MSRWLGQERDAAAVDRILDAAGTVFASSGIASTGMGDIAKAAGCSRATLYRYFKDRHALRRAFVHRAAREIARRVAREITEVRDPTHRFVEAVTGTLTAVRSDPVLRAWFSGGDSTIATELAHESEVISAIGAAFLSRDGSDLDRDLLLRARWTVRVVVSLLASPEPDPGDERALVARFLAPVVLEVTATGPDAAASVVPG